jgi:hypothetical protein
MHIGIFLTFPLLLPYFNQPWIFSTDFQKFSDIKFCENPSSCAELIRAGGQTDRDEANVAFRNFINTPIVVC